MPEPSVNSIELEHRPYCGPDGLEPDPQAERDIDGELGTIYDGLPEEKQRKLWFGLLGREWEPLRRAAVGVIGTFGRYGYFEFDSCNRKVRGLAQDGIDKKV